MARKRHLFLRRIQSFLNSKNIVVNFCMFFQHKNKIKKNLSYILSWGLLIVILISPAVAQVNFKNSAYSTQSSSILLQQGKDFYDKGQFSEAIDSLLKAESIFSNSEDILNLSITLSNLSLAYQQVGEWEKAKEKIHKAIGILEPKLQKSVDLQNLFLQALLVKNQLLFATGNPEESLKIWQKAASTFRNIKNNTGEITSQIYQSIALQELGLYREAFKIIIDHIHELENQPNSVRSIAFRALGNMLRVVGDTEEFAELAQSVKLLQADANEIKKLECFDPIDETNKLNYLDRSYLLLKKSLQLSELPQDQAQALFGLGNISRTAYKRSRDSYERTQGLKDKKNADCQSQLAFNYYQQIKDINSASLIQKVQAQLNQLSLLLDYQEWVKKSKDEQETKLVPDDKWQKKQLLVILNSLDKLKVEIDDLPLTRATIYARVNFSKSLIKLLAFNEQSQSKNQDNKSKTFQQIEELLRIAIEQSQKLGDKRAESYAWGYLGRYFYQKSESLSKDEKLLRNKFLQEAQKCTKEALSFIDRLADEEKSQQVKELKQLKDIAYQWQWQLGRILREQGKLNNKPQKSQQAIAAYEVAINTLESVRSDLTSFNNPDLQFSFRDTVEPVYREFVDLLLPYNDLQQVKQAQEALQKAQETIENLQVAELENFLRCRLTNTKLVSIYKEIDSRNLEAAVIYPIILEDRLEIILKLPQKEQEKEKQQLIRRTTKDVTKKELERVVRLLKQDIEKGFIGKDKNAHFQEVYRWLFGNIEKDLEDSNFPVKTLVFVLDGALRDIPMAALYDGKKYLFQKYSLALNLGVKLTETKPLQKGKFKVLAAGTGIYQEPDVRKLEYIDSELDAIKCALPGQVNDNIRTCNFTTKKLQQQIQSQRFDVVHLATHGEFSSSPDKTYIQAYDRKFYLNEMNKLLRSREETRPDRIRLLVLSACYTAQGDKRAVLGIAGVSVQTAADSTIASLYKAEDRATTVLMEQFYKNLGNHNVTKAEALRLAQEYLFNDEYKEPKFWAPFVLVGDWR